jgi:SAM-dependent methyltransferase
MTLQRLMKAKEGFGWAYEAPEAVTYYRAYEATRLSVVEYPAALTRTVIAAGLTKGPVVDLGCGYGTLGILLRTDLDIEAIFRAYLRGGFPRARSGSPTIVGVDRSWSALRVAEESGAIDRGLLADLNFPSPHLTRAGDEAIVICTAVLGYLRPQGLRRVLDLLRPRIALLTAVTWLLADLRDAFAGSDFRLTQLTEVPVFQRWASDGEKQRMPAALVQGAHRAHCFAAHRAPIPVTQLKDRIEDLRLLRSSNQWLAAGRSGCELIPGRDRRQPAAGAEAGKW